MNQVSTRVDQATGPLTPAETDGVLSRRLMAYLVDFVVIFILTALIGAFIGLLGIFTFGLAWGLYVILIPGTAILYSAVTVGGRRQSTIGMRTFGLRVIQTVGGRRVDPFTAGLHALFFYVAAGTFVLWLADIVIGVARPDRRLGHDLILGLAVIRG
jgi:uncharacterized RDD family membrane protein YckC